MRDMCEFDGPFAIFIVQVWEALPVRAKEGVDPFREAGEVGLGSSFPRRPVRSGVVQALRDQVDDPFVDEPATIAVGHHHRDHLQPRQLHPWGGWGLAIRATQATLFVFSPKSATHSHPSLWVVRVLGDTTERRVEQREACRLRALRLM
eukprot:gene5969-biopygen4942